MLTLLAIHLLWSLCALVWTTRRHRIPASAAAWAAVILLLPVVGTLIYLAFGLPQRPHAVRRPGSRGDALSRLIRSGCGTYWSNSTSTAVSTCSHYEKTTRTLEKANENTSKYSFLFFS